MPIKNYTSEVPVDRSILKIESLLIQAGAMNIVKTYENKEIEGITFNILVNNIPYIFKIPAKVDAVYHKLYKIRKTRMTKGQLESLKKQAQRTAWKNVHDWIQMQLTMIELEQVEVMEVLMPYIYNPDTRKTYFEHMKGNDFKLLNP